MSFKRIGIIVLTTGALAGCGSSGHFVNHPAPPTPVNLTVYINDQRVSLSPSSVGAGPVVLIVTNQASTAQSLTVLPAGASAAQPIADTGPINPQATTQVTVNLNTPGAYTVATAVHRVVTDNELRAQLIEAGIERLREFDIAKSRRKLLDAIELVAGPA